MNLQVPSEPGQGVVCERCATVYNVINLKNNGLTPCTDMLLAIMINVCDNCIDNNKELVPIADQYPSDDVTM